MGNFVGKTVHVIPHFHWDREWYFNTARSKIYLLKDLADVLHTLETKPAFRYFMVDAQASLLEDYLHWKPEDEERIRSLVKAGRLLIGPWYTQTDQLLICGESIVRNLFYGIECCERLGGCMKIGYVPDSFGQSAQMPQIYQDFGMQDTVFWRGVSDDEVAKTDFLWRGADGSTVYAYQLPYGYHIGGNIPEEEQDLTRYLQHEIIERIGARSATDQLYFPNGFDQAPIRKNLPELLQRANQLDQENTYILSSAENYIAAVKKEDPVLEEVRGELVNGKLMRIHKSIFSSRSDLKMLNTEVQNYVTNVLEPLLSLSYSLGNEYPSAVVRDIWKLLFENAAHDSIGSCVSDATNEDVYLRYKEARDLAGNLVEIHSRQIAVRIAGQRPGQEIALTLFNTMPYERSTVVRASIYITEKAFRLRDAQGNDVPYSILSRRDLTDYVLAQTIRLNPSKAYYKPQKVYLAEVLLAAEKLPALGYQQLYLEWCDESAEQPVRKKAENVLENAYYRIVVNANGSLDILDKEAGREYPAQGIFEENGDGGDSFNYSPPAQDLVVSSRQVKAVCTCSESSLFQQASISFTLQVPADLAERAAGRCTAAMPFEVQVTLRKDSRVVDFSVSVENQAASHRLVVKFATGIASRVSLADQQFGLIERPVQRPELALWEKDPAAWNEMPITIEPLQTFVALRDKTHGCGIFPQGVREYQITGDTFDTITLTLFRSYGFMGRENLLYRPGRASGEKVIATPAAQLLGRLEFAFSYYLYQGDFGASHMAYEAKCAATPVQCYEYADFLNGRLIFVQEEVERDLPTEYSLLSFQDRNVICSAVKKAEHGNELVVRCYSGLAEGNAGTGLWAKDRKHLTELHLDETPKAEGTAAVADATGHWCLPGLPPCKFRTFGLE